MQTELSKATHLQCLQARDQCSNH